MGGHGAVGVVLTILHVQNVADVDITVIIRIPLQLSPAYLSGVIGVERMFRAEIPLAINVGVQDVVGHAVGLHLTVEDTAFGAVQHFDHIVAHADGVAVVEVVVETDASTQFAVVLISPLVVALRPQGIGVCGLLQQILLAVVRLAEADHTEHIKAVVPVIHVRLLHKVRIHRLVIAAAQSDTEAVALPLHRTDAYHRTHRSIITGTGIMDHLHTLDVL